MAVVIHVIQSETVLARQFYAPDYSVLIPTWRSKKMGVFGGALQKVDQRDGAGGGNTIDGVAFDRSRYGYIQENVTQGQSKLPVSRPVFCFDFETKRLVRSAWSNENGIVRFEDLDPSKTFMLTSDDITDTFNSEIIGKRRPTPYYPEK